MSTRSGSGSGSGRATGPRSTDGKRRSSQNAYQHGLSIPVRAVPHLDAKADELARQIAGEHGDAPRLLQCRFIAEAQLDLRRVRAAKQQLFERMRDTSFVTRKTLRRRIRAAKPMLYRPDKLARDAWRREVEVMNDEDERLPDAIPQLIKYLTKLERYERRAFSRLKTAIRDFDQKTD
jgi:hypothetical protein